MLTNLALLLLLAGAASPQQWTGRVVGIQDGDTLTVLRGATQIKIRLHGIDCPETAQPFGSRAQQKTAELAFGRTVIVQPGKADRYGRTLAVVILPNGHSLNDELLRAGLAWWYRQYAPKERALARLEDAAREAHLGLWADQDPTPPWLWRKAKKAISRASQ
ncbi:MAG: thermonuclease family protein [Nitrospirota bacterium]|nr:thermonuclease family protein [Nitrospirota bacterium]